MSPIGSASWTTPGSALMQSRKAPWRNRSLRVRHADRRRGARVRASSSASRSAALKPGRTSGARRSTAHLLAQHALLAHERDLLGAVLGRSRRADANACAASSSWPASCRQSPSASQTAATSAGRERRGRRDEASSARR